MRAMYEHGVTNLKHMRTVASRGCGVMAAWEGEERIKKKRRAGGGGGTMRGGERGKKEGGGSGAVLDATPVPTTSVQVTDTLIELVTKRTFQMNIFLQCLILHKDTEIMH